MANSKDKRMIKNASNNVSKAIRAQTDPTNKFSSGLSSEGYLGGYRDALNDVQLALNGVIPNRYWSGHKFWEDV